MENQWFATSGFIIRRIIGNRIGICMGFAFLTILKRNKTKRANARIMQITETRKPLIFPLVFRKTYMGDPIKSETNEAKCETLPNQWKTQRGLQLWWFCKVKAFLRFLVKAFLRVGPASSAPSGEGVTASWPRVKRAFWWRRNGILVIRMFARKHMENIKGFANFDVFFARKHVRLRGKPETDGKHIGICNFGDFAWNP